MYKGGSKQELTNYRPISLLSCISKILEKLIHTRIYNFLEKNQLFNNFQFGFRKKLGTNDAILTFISKLLTNFDNKDYCLSILVDLSKAFDTINHEILIYKLERLGIRGLAKLWLQDYLKDRKQSV